MARFDVCLFCYVWRLVFGWRFGCRADDDDDDGDDDDNDHDDHDHGHARLCTWHHRYPPSPPTSLFAAPAPLCGPLMPQLVI